MPRPNPPRTIATEYAVARRIAHERESRGMSYEGLALQMTHAGCPINASALFRIEKGDPPRRITVNELSALARVFGMPIDGLLEDPALAQAREFRAVMHEVLDAHDKADAAVEALENAVRALQRYAKDHPEVVAGFERDPALQSYLTMEV